MYIYKELIIKPFMRLEVPDGGKDVEMGSIWQMVSRKTWRNYGISRNTKSPLRLHYGTTSLTFVVVKSSHLHGIIDNCHYL